MALGVSMILLIGCGNSLRRDDGAGLVLAELLERNWRSGPQEVQRVSVHQLTPDLAEYIARKEVSVVVFVDSRVAITGARGFQVQVHKLDVEDSFSTTSHHMDPKTVMLYLQRLYGKNPRSWTVTVPGLDFDHGEGLSQIARTAIADALILDGLAPDKWLTKLGAETAPADHSQLSSRTKFSR
jgi:hydrogenase maturation protease